MEILLIGYATLRFGTDTLASSGISVKDNQNHTFMLPLLMVGLDISIRVLEVKMVYSVFTVHTDILSVLETERYNYQTGVVYEPLFSKQIL
jgi:hypothetical protein